MDPQVGSRRFACFGVLSRSAFAQLRGYFGVLLRGVRIPLAPPPNIRRLGAQNGRFDDSRLLGATGIEFCTKQAFNRIQRVALDGLNHARERWPQLSEIRLRYRAGFAYVDGVLADGEVLRLRRLRYGGSARDWGFAMYRASYEDSFLPTGFMGGAPEDALDTACGLYLADPTGWT